MKKILIIAGPNGAGKTTFAEEFLPNEAGCPEFVNADLIAAGSQDPPLLLENGDNRPPDKLMEDSAEYRTTKEAPRPVKPLDDPDFIGAEAALRRASAKAVAHARAAGLEPVVRQLVVENPTP